MVYWQFYCIFRWIVPLKTVSQAHCLTSRSLPLSNDLPHVDLHDITFFCVASCRTESNCVKSKLHQFARPCNRGESYRIILAVISYVSNVWDRQQCVKMYIAPAPSLVRMLPSVDSLLITGTQRRYRHLYKTGFQQKPKQFHKFSKWTENLLSLNYLQHCWLWIEHLNVKFYSVSDSQLLPLFFLDTSQGPVWLVWSESTFEKLSVQSTVWNFMLDYWELTLCQKPHSWETWVYFMLIY